MNQLRFIWGIRRNCQEQRDGNRDVSCIVPVCWHRVMGLPGKPDEISGAEVEKYYRDGHIREIAEYCEERRVARLKFSVPCTSSVRLLVKITF